MKFKQLVPLKNNLPESKNCRYKSVDHDRVGKSLVSINEM